jgi:NTE family protein
MQFQQKIWNTHLASQFVLVLFHTQTLSTDNFIFNGVRWTERDGRYLWDGSLLTNTPMLEVIRASPKQDKKFYIVDVFPRKQEEIPQNMVEVWHRARDIMFMDKTDKNIEMLKANERCLSLLRKIYSIVNTENAQLDDNTKARLKEIEPEYDTLVKDKGILIKEVIRIGRQEEMHYLLEDTDFSLYRIKKLISAGEVDAENAIAEKRIV